jgi:hypothetical protein
VAAAPELAPFAGRVVLRQVIWPFTALCAFLFAWGLLSALDAFTRACFGTAEGAVGWIPYLGRVVSSGIHGIEHKITSILGRWVSYFEVQAGIRWHGLARVVSQLAADVEAAALMDWTIVQRLSHFLTRAQVHLLLKGLHAIGKVVTEQTTVIEHKIVRVEKIVGTKANSVVAHRVGALAGELEHVIEWDIPRLRARDHAIAERLDRAWHWIRSHPLALPTTLAAGAVAVALGRLGAGWIRCRNWNRIGRHVCRLPLGLIEDILAASVVGFAVADLCDFAALAETIAEQFVPELMALVDVENALLGCHGATAAPALPIGRLYLPPTNRGLALTG